LGNLRSDLVLVLCFGVAGAVLVVLGLILLLLGFAPGKFALLFVFGLGLIIAAYALAAEFGFVEKWYGSGAS
jgi:hypothetical protein